MSASIIHPTALNPSQRQPLPKTAGGRRQPGIPTAASTTPEMIISVQEKLAKTNAQNRLYDAFSSFVAIFFVFCICAAMVATGGWVVFELFTEVSSWSSADLIDVIKNSNR